MFWSLCYVCLLLVADLGSIIGPLEELKAWLEQETGSRPPLDQQSFASTALSQSQAALASEMLWLDFKKQKEKSLKVEWDQKTILHEKWKLRFDYKIFGEKPSSGRSLYISMHGGGNSGQRVNDRQWENQKRLYNLKEGIYIAPRAPVDDWNMWFQPQLDPLLERLILAAILFEDVHPDRVYLTGYSAGGDGVYRLAPRLADRWAAAAMMAGHPGEQSPANLRNLPFALHVGELDSAYNRNKEAVRWGGLLKKLHEMDPKGYIHQYQLHAGREHWMKGEDKVGIEWMAEFKRITTPEKIIWERPTTHNTFYWLGCEQDSPIKRISATVSGQTINVEAESIQSLFVRLSDTLVNLNQPVIVQHNGKVIFKAIVPRTILNLHRSWMDRQDIGLVFPAEVRLGEKP